MTLNSPAPLDTYQALVSAFAEFLTVAIHLILYERDIYPRESFLKTRKYDFPVQQNRHPKVCKWIMDAVAAVDAEMLKCTVRQTSLILYSPESVPLERYVFSTDAFPLVRQSEILVPFESYWPELQRSPSLDDSRPSTPTPQAPPINQQGPTMVELTAQFSAVLSRFTTQSAKLSPLPEDCSFTVAIELRDPPVGQVPLDNNVTWLPAEPGLQHAAKEMQKSGTAGSVDHAEDENGAMSKRQRRGEYLGGARTTAVRSVEAGAFIMEVWIEEAKEKLGSSAPKTTLRSQLLEDSSTVRHAYVEDDDS